MSDVRGGSQLESIASFKVVDYLLLESSIVQADYQPIQRLLAKIGPIRLSPESLAMLAETTSRYVTRNPEILSGEPIITGTRTSVRAIVGLWRLGTTPEEIPNHLPHLSLAQVFDALSFYLDNQAEVDRYIERNQIPDELVHPLLKPRVLGLHKGSDYWMSDDFNDPLPDAFWLGEE
jgi:uncharacterized protein (DUF433 family)